MSPVMSLIYIFIFRFSQRLTGKSPDSLEELREIAFDADEDQEEQHGDESEADESEDRVELGTEQSYAHNMPHEDESTTDAS